MLPITDKITMSRPVVRRVQESTPVYEDEGSLREARGAVTVPGGAWWGVTLSRPIDDALPPDAPARLRIDRRGAGIAALDGTGGVELTIRPSELAALFVALDGVVRQARRDGVIP